MRDPFEPICTSNLLYVLVAAYAYYVHNNVCFGMLLVVMAIVSLMYHRNREAYPYKVFDYMFGGALFIVSCIGIRQECRGVDAITTLGFMLLLSKLINTIIFIYGKVNKEQYDDAHTLWHYSSAAHLALVSHAL